METRDYKAVTRDGHEILLEGATKEYSYCLAIQVHSQCWEPWAWTHTAEETRAEFTRAHAQGQGIVEVLVLEEVSRVS